MAAALAVESRRTRRRLILRCTVQLRAQLQPCMQGHRLPRDYGGKCRRALILLVFQSTTSSTWRARDIFALCLSSCRLGDTGPAVARVRCRRGGAYWAPMTLFPKEIQGRGCPRPRPALAERHCTYLSERRASCAGGEGLFPGLWKMYSTRWRGETAASRGN